MIRVAVLGSCESVPWLPLTMGLVEGFCELGCDARAFRVSETPWHYLAELELFGPDLLIVAPSKHDWMRMRPYVEWWTPHQESGLVVVGYTGDDPYDLQTGLALARVVDLICTPEPLAVDCYRGEGQPAVHVDVPVSAHMHPAPLEPAEPVYDVFWFGGTFWTPRKRLIPAIRDYLRKQGRVYGEVAGRTRWVAGLDLAYQLHRTRMTLELPRFSQPTRSNPYQIPCTWTGPRLHIAASTATFALVIDGKHDGKYSRYPRCGLEDWRDALDHWLAPKRADERREIRLAMCREFLERHRPRVRAQTMLAAIDAYDLGSEAVRRLARSQRESGACSDPPSEESETA